MRNASRALAVIATVALTAVMVTACAPRAEPDASAPADTGEAAGAKITIIDSGFLPPILNIRAGDTVTWVNEGSTTHTVLGGDGMDSGEIAPGRTYAKQFATGGTFGYSCSIHTNMTGSIVVK